MKTADLSATPPDQGTRASDDLERAMARGLALGLPVVAVLGALAAAAVADAGTAILVLAGAVLLAVVALLWASLRTLAGDTQATMEEALAIADNGAEERKRIVLQALRDLEQERSLGKLDETDYAELSRAYRAEAKHLLRALEQDRAPQRAAAAQWVAARLAGSPAPHLGTPACAGCSATNDADAAFCKRCGAKLGGSDAH